LSGKKDSIDQANLTGSPVEEEFKRFEQGQLSFYSAFAAMRQDYEMAKAKNDEKQIDSLQKAAVDLNASQRRSIVSYALGHPSSCVSPYVVFSNFANDPDAHLLDSAYKGMDSTIQASYYGRRVKGMRDDAIRTAVGNPASDFTLPDTHSKLVSLSSYKGKYTLVDFWASWCGPCRGENPNFVKAYRKYHAKGFAILGVSLDSQKESWEQAIKKDKLSWTQVSDLKGWQNSAAELYGIKSIPMNFLLDKDGKIIGKSLRGQELEEKLGEIMK
jgi:peroxiredoxin